MPAITIESIPLLLAGVALAAAVVIVSVVRRASVSLPVAALAGLGLAALALAAGGPRVASDARQRLAVHVDTSASTEGAQYRDPQMLRSRVEALIGDRPSVVVNLGTADGRTTWTTPPPDVSAVLLFSDGRFEPPATARPVFAVIDPALEQAADASVSSMTRRGDRVVVTTSNTGAPRKLAVTGVKPATRPVVPQGNHTLILAADPTASVNTATLAAGDRWPQNDALSVLAPPPVGSERWWVGGGGAPAGEWRVLDPAQLPSDPVAYLAPSVIVFNNVAATSLAPAQGQRLGQYVRDLGGGLLILGGDRAFAAGGYDGSALGALSPLASSPPAPAAHWTFLLDASGSMAGQLDGQTRFAAAVAAAQEAIAKLPPNDLLSVGGFSDQLRWWLRGQSVKDVELKDPPTPRGPTNLDAALRSLVSSRDKSHANQVVLLTDGQVQLGAVDEIAASLKAVNVRLHVFAIGAGPGLSALRTLATATGGSVAEETEAAQWAAGLVKLLRHVSPQYLMTTPVGVRFTELPPIATSAWNRTWLRPGAQEVARTLGEEPAPMAARANVGAGKVVAIAFRPPDEHIVALAGSVQAPPRDPRLSVSWRSGRELLVDVDAGALNNLSPSLVITSLAGASQTHPVPQTGPGRYALSLPAPRETAYATLSESGRVIDRFAVPGRYEPEFDAIGNDRAALHSLAQRTGGRVIEPNERGPLALPAPAGTTRLAPPVAAAGALLVGLGLIVWRGKR